ncbi:hypothetical protein B0T11DRAFT_120817 [Plectosphaerella cucumerina]|uniref:Uncharacterized protein n=1 Tax=Plectosphaerella cucumerina TaxID=40658 RepID=A0A8K0X1P0_9PEZI|nr:hypothetical protein B0T11DRAFT_120817 [Plectosphaerella cucumerina]
MPNLTHPPSSAEAPGLAVVNFRSSHPIKLSRSSGSWLLQTPAAHTPDTARALYRLAGSIPCDRLLPDARQRLGGLVGARWAYPTISFTSPTVSRRSPWTCDPVNRQHINRDETIKLVQCRISSVLLSIQEPFPMLQALGPPAHRAVTSLTPGSLLGVPSPSRVEAKTDRSAVIPIMTDRNLRHLPVLASNNGHRRPAAVGRRLPVARVGRALRPGDDHVMESQMQKRMRLEHSLFDREPTATRVSHAHTTQSLTGISITMTAPCPPPRRTGRLTSRP